jgi:probable F420-dependent oxidoreductase
VNIPHFGPGTTPDMLRQWARVVEGLGYDLLMVSDHVTVTPDVASQYPAPFYEPFTTLSYLAGVTERIRLGITVLIVPYRHPLLTARMAAGLDRLSGGRFVLGVGVGWAKQEFEVLGVPFHRRGKLTDEHLDAIRDHWSKDVSSYQGVDIHTEPRPAGIPIWVGGNSEAAMRRSARVGDAWHPLRFTMPWLRATLPRAAELGAAPLVPRIALRLTSGPLGDDRLAGEGTIGQVRDDLAELAELGVETVVLDPFGGDPAQTLTPQPFWRDLATIQEHV